MIVDKELLSSGDILGCDSAGDVAIDGVIQVRELTVAGEAVVHFVGNSGNVVVGSLELYWNIHVTPACNN